MDLVSDSFEGLLEMAESTDPVTELQSAEWYAMRFQELRAWLKKEEDKATEREQSCDSAGLTWGVGKAAGAASLAFRLQKKMEDLFAANQQR